MQADLTRLRESRSGGALLDHSDQQVGTPLRVSITTHQVRFAFPPVGKLYQSGLVLLLLVLMQFSQPAWSSGGDNSIPSSQLAIELKDTADWLRSGDYLSSENAAPLGSGPVGQGTNIRIARFHTFDIVQAWRSQKALPSGSGVSFCTSAGSQIGEIDTQIAALESLLVVAVSRLLDISADLIRDLTADALLDLVTERQGASPALRRIEATLSSILQFQKEAPLLRSAIWACDTGTFSLDYWQDSMGSPDIGRMAFNAVIRSLLDSGVRDFVFNSSMVPPLELGQSTFQSLSVRDSVMQGLDLAGSTFSSLKISESLLVQCGANGECDGGFSLENSVVSGDVELEGVDLFGRFSAAEANIAGNFSLRDSRFNRMESTRNRYRSRREKESGSPSAPPEIPPEVESLIAASSSRNSSRSARSLSLFAARVEGSTSIIETEIFGAVFMGRSRLGELRMAGTHLDGTLDLWGSTVAGPSFVGHGNSGASVPGVTVTGSILAWYANFDDLQINNVWVGGDLVLNQAKLDGLLFIGETDMRGSLTGRNLRANSVELSGLSALSVQMRGSQTNGEFLVHESRIGTFDVILAQMRGFTAYAAYGPDGKIRPENECLTLADESTAPPAFGVSKEGRGAEVAHRRPNCFGKFEASGTVVGSGLYLSGHFDKVIDLSEAQITGTTRLGGRGIGYAPDACVNMRDAVLGTIIMDANESDEDKSGLPGPAAIDAFGAKYDLIRASNPVSIERRHETALASVRMFLGQPMKKCGDGGLVAEGASDAQGIHYMPGVYDALARGYEATGDVDMARAVKIEKNRAYASGLEKLGGSVGVMLERAVYFLSDVINGFGYRNVNAVLWLLGLVSTGYILSWIAAAREERHNSDAFQGAIAMARAHASRRTGQGMNLFMFSLDRAIPSLALDTTFGTHTDKTMPGWLSVWFYIQRIACFLIIILMIAGAFEVFQ